MTRREANCWSCAGRRAVIGSGCEICISPMPSQSGGHHHDDTHRAGMAGRSRGAWPGGECSAVRAHRLTTWQSTQTAACGPHHQDLSCNAVNI